VCVVVRFCRVVVVAVGLLLEVEVEVLVLVVSVVSTLSTLVLAFPVVSFSRTILVVVCALRSSLW
jgi:hypothetical protein